MRILKNDWEPLLEQEFKQPYYLQLRQFLIEEHRQQTVYPEMTAIYNALHYTSYEDTKVVILGQDPYHGPGQAHGLSFSVQPDVTLPPSLRNIFKELHADLGVPIPENGSLINWAKEGVLLLNTVLTVRKKQPASHQGKGWEQFTNQVIETVNNKEDAVVFILWGKHAQAKEELITNDRHFIIKTSHPSPFSANRGFFGSKPFSKANDFLVQAGRSPVNWKLV